MGIMEATMITFDLWFVVAIIITALFIGTMFGMWVGHAFRKG